MNDESQKIQLVKPSEVRVVSVSKPTVLQALAAPNLVHDVGVITGFGGPIMPNDFACDTRLRLD